MTFEYICRHIPTGREITRVINMENAYALLIKLNEWNRVQPGLWQYWALL